MTDGDAIDFNVFRGVREYGGPNAHLFRRNFFLKFELLRNSFYAFEVRAASFDVFLDAKKSCGRTSLAATFFTSKVPQLFFSHQFFLLHI
jgi:hypothetical protein